MCHFLFSNAKLAFRFAKSLVKHDLFFCCTIFCIVFSCTYCYTLFSFFFIFSKCLFRFSVWAGVWVSVPVAVFVLILAHAV